MKKLYLIPILAVMTLATACGDKGEDLKDNLAKYVIGNYEGYTSASCAYFSGNMNAEQHIIVTEGSSDNKVNIQYISPTWGTFTISDAAVVANEQSYAVTGDGICKMGMDGKLNDYSCTLSGSIDVEKSSPSFVFNVPAVMGGLSITFSSGDIPTEDK